jgi:integrase
LRQEFEDALTVIKKLGLIRKGNERSRRPTIEELDRLIEHFGRIRGHRPSSLPMQKIVAFALFSTRRQEEITLLRWDDLDEDRILVRDMKHPGDKRGNNVNCELPSEALAIIKSMPHDEDRIFPYSTDAISAAFTPACKILGIKDLRFHDLRHEGISRLFEIGRTIPQVAAVSGHRSWTSLKRYTHIRQSTDNMRTGNGKFAWDAVERPLNSTGERSLHTEEVVGSILQRPPLNQHIDFYNIFA